MKIKIVIGILVGIMVLMICAVTFLGKTLHSASKELESITPIDVADVADGVYEGIAETPLVKVTVEVTVKDHVIENIKLVRHQNGKGEPAESMIPEMIAKNTSEVDGVSGATLSSTTIRAAVRNALAGGIDE